MKKKFLKEQQEREKAIIESFAKTFNKIKRLDEAYGMSFEEAKEEAKRKSEEEGGVAQHVNQIGNDQYIVSDFYDSDTTVASFGLGIDEINIKKGIAGLGLAAALAGAPEKSMAQTQPEPVKTSMMDTNNIANQPNDKAAMMLLRSYRKNPFSADDWSKQSKETMKLFKTIQKMLEYYMNTGRLEQEDLDKLGAKYKSTSVAISFLNRDEKSYTMREDDIA